MKRDILPSLIALFWTAVIVTTVVYIVMKMI